MRDIHLCPRHGLRDVDPYMVVTPRGYTKHYYNGSQRIASRIGGYCHDESVFVPSPTLTNTLELLLNDINSTWHFDSTDDQLSKLGFQWQKHLR